MFLDTSVLVEILFARGREGSEEVLIEHLRGEDRYIAEIQLAEVADISIRRGISPEVWLSRLTRETKQVPLDQGISITAAIIKNQMRSQGISAFGVLDGIILATARSIGQPLLTYDQDYRLAEDVIVLV